MMHSDSLAKLAPALVAAQTDIRAVEKSATNPHFKSKYAPLDAIIAMVRPALAAHGLAVIQSAGPHEDGKALLVETRLIHSSGEWMASVAFIPLAKSDPQGAGAAITYGRRFGLSALLSIATDDDDDSNTASRPAARRAERPPVRPTASTEAPTSKAATSEPSEPEPVTRDGTIRIGGRPLGDFTTDELRQIIGRKQHNPKYATLVKACRGLIADRALGNTDDDKVARMHASVAAEDDQLPFR